MSNNKLNIDAYTKALVKKSGVDEPSESFTSNVMGQILKDPSVQISFLKKEDGSSKVWLFLAIAIMFIGYGVFYYLKNGYNTVSQITSIETPRFFKPFMELFVNLFQELSLSPYILISLLGVVVLIVMDKTIVRYFYSL